MQSGDDVRVEVLGQIQVVSDGAVVAVSPQLRRLIGLLVAAGGGTVSSARLAEYVAEGVADSTVRTAVSRLRKVVGDRLVLGDGGYRLVLGNGELDASIFDGMVERARSASMPDRVEALDGAVALWRGPAFGDHGDEEWASAVATRLNLAHAAAIEDLAEAFGDVGRHQEAIELLEPHVGDHPYRERPVALLMCTLDALGRRADAVRAFQRFRTVLRDDTGLEPSADLRALESDLLADDDEPDVPTGNDMPTGTVTFLFTDIEGSTERWADDEESMAGALAAHDEVLRLSVQSHGGVVFKHTGDGVCAAFASAPGAVGAAIDAQDVLELPVRMGIHIGEAELRDGDYFGTTLNRVARIMDAGHGGQIVMSGPVAGLVTDVDTSDLGGHRLKGLSTSERIFQVGDHEFPALRVATAHKGNLPVDLTEFIGRSQELASLADAVLGHRLVTLIGVGGTGKTRLAIETAESLAPTFPDGCWIVELSQVLVPEAVPFSIAAGVGVDPPKRGDVLDLVIDRLRHQRTLLIIDNCEHVLDASADAVERILAACPAVTILATSREPLMVAGEHMMAVPSLTPDAAMELFVTRAGSEAGGLVFDEQQSTAAVEVCERLDRLPLAIELAASRLRTMTPVEIRDRLDERFRLLVGGRRSRMERHQTMRGTVDWSYDLCSEDERSLFDLVSVFMAEFDLDAARTVGTSGGLSEFDVDDALASLVDRSLVQRSVADDGTTRFSLLETMRAYGREHLAEAGCADAVRDVHAAYMDETLYELSLRSLGPDEFAVHRRIRSLAPDALVTIDRFIDRHDFGRAIDIARCYADAAAGVGRAMCERIASARDHADAETSAIDLFDQLLLEIVTADGLWLWQHWQDRSAQRKALELLENGYTPRRHVVAGSPLTVVPWAFDDASHGVVRRYIDRFGRAPAIVRFTLLTEFQISLGFSSCFDWATELRPEIERLAAELDSDIARRRCDAIVALDAERAEDFAVAARYAQRAIAGVERPNGHDVLAAMRVVRLKQRAGEELSGDDLRRPFEWCRAESLLREVGGSLCSAAIAVDLFGRAELAERMVKQVLPIEARPFYIKMYESKRMSSRLIELLRSEVPPDEPYDDVIADVFRLADELDQAQGTGSCS